MVHVSGMVGGEAIRSRVERSPRRFGGYLVLPTSTSLKPKRSQAGSKQGVGDARAALIYNAACHVAASMRAGYYLEAVALLESLIADRMEKRVQYLHKHTTDPAVASALDSIKDGFTTLGASGRKLLAVESDPGLRNALVSVDRWRASRNKVIHAMVKLGDGADAPWKGRLREAKVVASAGLAVLLELDVHERRVSHASRNKRWASATCPDGLSPLGQLDCEWCAAKELPLEES